MIAYDGGRVVMPKVCLCILIVFSLVSARLAWSGSISGRSDRGQEVFRLIDLMNEVLTGVEELRRAAREDRDMLMLNCINDKLILLKGWVQLSREIVREKSSKAGFQEWSAKDLSHLRKQHFRVEKLVREAGLCVGAQSLAMGEMIRAANGPLGMIAYDLGQVLDIVGVVRSGINRPPAASPYQ